MERDTPVVENGPIEGASNSQEEDDRLVARARVVGVDYEFAKPGVVETEDDKKKKAAKPKTNIRTREKVARSCRRSTSTSTSRFKSARR